jgi:hypothetical protein
VLVIGVPSVRGPFQRDDSGRIAGREVRDIEQDCGVAEVRLARGGRRAPAREVTVGKLTLRALEKVGPRGQVLDVMRPFP